MESDCPRAGGSSSRTASQVGAVRLILIGIFCPTYNVFAQRVCSISDLQAEQSRGLLEDPLVLLLKNSSFQASLNEKWPKAPPRET